MNSRLLIIDDDEKLNLLLTDYLGEMGFEVLSAVLPEEGLQLLEHENPDLVILDVMLPEMVARIQSVLRRVQPNNLSAVQKFGGLIIDFQKREVTQDEKIVQLTSNEFECLSLLVKNTGKVLNRDQIMEELRGIEWDAFNRSVDITMSRLRNKLADDPKNPRFIKTIWGTGYMFIGDRDGN